MANPVTTQMAGQVLLVTIANPPVNALSAEVRQGLMEALRKADDADVMAVVLQAQGKHFIAGADIHEFGEPPQPPLLTDICRLVEACPKPVVAALHGAVLGGGLEMALAAHYRLAARNARLGLPEVNLGLMPGAGGTVRAPRLIGGEAALTLMLSGKPIDASRAQALGMVDRLVDTADVGAEALAWADELIATAAGTRPTCARCVPDVAAARQAIVTARTMQARKSVPLFSPQRIIDVVEMTLELPFEQGLEAERRCFVECMASPQRKGLTHAFLAEHAVASLPELASVQARPMNTIGVVGGGTMGAGIAVCCLQAGLLVTMVERDAAGCERGRRHVETIIDDRLARGRISQMQHARLLRQFTATCDYEQLAAIDLVIEAAFEDMAVKKAVFAELDRCCKAGAVLATNTSYLDVNVIAACTSRPEDVIGLHFFSPAHVMQLLEVIVATKSAPDVVASAFELAKRLGKVAVRSGVCDGFIGNRLLASYRQVAYRLVQAGASPYDVDVALRDFGYPIGPFQMFDLAGGDIGWAERKRRGLDRANRTHYVSLPDVLCERGWFGHKTQRGWYRYPDGRREGEEDPEVLAVIDAERRRLGIRPRRISPEEIRERYLAAMINAGADVVREGIALRPLDVDVVLIKGYGFPRHHGGPMAYADSLGLARVLASIKRFAKHDAAFWRASPLLEELVAKDRDFASLNYLS